MKYLPILPQKMNCGNILMGGENGGNDWLIDNGFTIERIVCDGLR